MRPQDVHRETKRRVAGPGGRELHRPPLREKAAIDLRLTDRLTGDQRIPDWCTRTLGAPRFRGEEPDAPLSEIALVVTTSP